MSLTARKAYKENAGDLRGGYFDADRAEAFGYGEWATRTGMGAALILGALGADRATIIKDFDRSNDAYRPLVEKLCADVRAAGGGEDEEEVVRAFMGVSVKNFNHALDLIDINWGSLQGYLEEAMEIGPEECLRLQERYLE